MFKKLTLIIFCVLYSVNIVYAKECSKEIINEAKKVKVEAIPVTAKGNIHYIVRIENLTPNLYIKVHEDHNNSENKYGYEITKNGGLNIIQYYLGEKVKYTISVYATDNNCKDKLNTLSITTKKFNTKYYFKVCVENPKYEKCKPFYEPTKEDKKQSNTEFVKEVREYEKTHKSFGKRIGEYIKKYYLYVLIPFLTIALIFIIIILIKKYQLKGKKK